jgi:hypothetical protein
MDGIGIDFLLCCAVSVELSGRVGGLLGWFFQSNQFSVAVWLLSGCVGASVWVPPDLYY